MSGRGEDWQQCPKCHVENDNVFDAWTAEQPCPYCGYDGWVPLRCCIPGRDRLLPHDGSRPVCRNCGIQIAVLHWNDQELREAVQGEQLRQLAAVQRNRRNGRVPQSRVYYVRLDADRIKIGFSILLESRLRALRVPNGNLLAAEPGGRELETQRHHQFAAERIHRGREDFRPTPRLLAWIDDLREQHGLPDFVLKPDTGTVTVRRAG